MNEDCFCRVCEIKDGCPLVEKDEQIAALKERKDELLEKLTALTAENKRLREALGKMIVLYDENDWYNDRVVEKARQAHRGGE